MVMPSQKPLPDYLRDIGNLTRGFSPVTLNYDWPTPYRLLGMTICAFLGTIINGFFVASFFVEGTLKNLGNVFLACVGISDLILTTVVMPTSAVVLLSGEWDSMAVCQSQQFLVETATYCYNIFFSFVAIESYYKMCRSYEEHDRLLEITSSITIGVFVVGFALAAVGVFFGLDYDYCQRLHFGNMYFKCATTAIFHITPTIITLGYLIWTIFKMHSRARYDGHYRRSLQYETDRQIMYLNIIAYTLYVLAWTPYMVVIYEFPEISADYYYNCAWLGVGRSVIVSLLYAIINSNFRSAFGYLFNYCCCKSSLTGSFNRHRRSYAYSTTSGEVRVHIMHQVTKVNSPQRGTLTIRETQDL